MFFHKKIFKRGKVDENKILRGDVVQPKKGCRSHEIFLAISSGSDNTTKR